MKSCITKHMISGNLNGCHFCHTCVDWFDNKEQHKKAIQKQGTKINVIEEKISDEETVRKPIYCRGKESSKSDEKRRKTQTSPYNQPNTHV